MEVLAKLGIDWKLLLAQAVNFAVLFWVLRRYAYQPMLDFLEKRTDKIEAGLKDAERATQKLREMEVKEKERVMVSAKAEIGELVMLSVERILQEKQSEKQKEKQSSI